MVADLTGKPENYVMTMIQKDIKMTFAGTDEPCCFIKVKSIGSLDPSSMSKSLCELIASKTNINTNRIYIEFIDVKASNWGFNSSTFGQSIYYFKKIKADNFIINKISYINNN